MQQTPSPKMAESCRCHPLDLAIFAFLAQISLEFSQQDAIA